MLISGASVADLADFSIAIGYRRGLSGCVLQNFTSLTLGQPVLSAVFPVPGLRIKHATADDSEAPNAFSSNSRPGTSSAGVTFARTIRKAITKYS
jgi:hypothetical protein